MRILRPTLPNHARDKLVTKSSLRFILIRISRRISTDSSRVNQALVRLIILSFSLFDILIWVNILLGLYCLRPKSSVNDSLLSVLDIIVKRKCLVPQFPQDHSEAVSIHFRGQWPWYFLHLAKNLRSRPHCCQSVIREDICILHEVVVFKIRNSYLDYHRTISHLL